MTEETFQKTKTLREWTMYQTTLKSCNSFGSVNLRLNKTSSHKAEWIKCRACYSYMSSNPAKAFVFITDLNFFIYSFVILKQNFFRIFDIFTVKLSLYLLQSKNLLLSWQLFRVCYSTLKSFWNNYTNCVRQIVFL